jgi:hypothetical protein
MSAMRRMLLALAVLNMVVAPLKAGLTINTETVRRCVVFLYAAGSDGREDTEHPLGTAFLVAVPLASDAKKSYVLLVTARHIVDPQWACLPGIAPEVAWVRLNKKQYDSEKDETGLAYMPLLLRQDGRQRWFRHRRDDIDVAVVLLNAMKFAECDLTAISVSDFGKPEEVKLISAGDDVVTAGLIPGRSGRKRNYPYFKFGKVSNILEEPFEQSCASGEIRALRLWFVAADLVPGNSGSPIFYQPPGSGGTLLGAPVMRPVLLGLQSLAFYDQLPGWPAMSAGVVGMTPVHYIYETIEQMALPDSDLYRGRPEEKGTQKK